MTGLTAFIVAMMRADRASLARANVDKLAAKYAIRADWARFYLEQWMSQ